MTFPQSDSFQDHHSDLYGINAQIDSLKMLTLHQTGLISRPSHFWTQINSFHDPVQWTIWNITQLTHFKTLILVYYSVSISMGDYLLNLHGRLPPSITLQNTLHSEFQTYFMKQRRKTHHMQDNQHISTPIALGYFYTGHPQYSSKPIPVKTPETSHQLLTAVSV